MHDSPNDLQTAFEYTEMSIAHQCLRGNHYSFIERTRDGKILHLIPIHPDRVTVKAKEGSAQGVEYHVKDEKGKTEVFSQEDIWHEKGLSSDGYEGISPIAMAKDAIQLAVEAELHGIAYYKNGARVSGYFEHPGKLSDKAKSNLRESAKDHMQGDNKFGIGVLEGGMKWHQISLSQEDSQYLETRNFQVEEIARLFRVPAILIGHPDKSATYASAEQFMLSFVIHTIRPWLVRREQSINKYLLSESDRLKYFAKHKIEGLLRGDTKSRYEGYSKAIASRWMNPNEVRALEDMNPRDGGDEFENPAVDVNKEPQNEQGDNDNGNTGDDDNQGN